MGLGGWSVINDPLPPGHKRGKDKGIHTTNCHIIDGATGYGFNILSGPIRVKYMPIPKFTVPNNGIELESSKLCLVCPHSRCFGSHFDVMFIYIYLVSSGFSFKPTSSSIIIVNQVYQRVNVQKGGPRHSVNPNLSYHIILAVPVPTSSTA